ncbi:translation elongation factor Ts [Portibacter lacus]|uniref:Elongation factor Ts n=1 Tax=Portibacter lacus TaxID=1099794 RepID=A0AA37SP74_9BACT|nr:translation elongation factor Ts [Portibacter lacus]GLR16912.1 elongation factor Ts [Portibacter lacus]
MSIKAADVKALRDQTGAGMMDCKKALTEANGDFEKAIEVLRKKGQKLSAKRADREAKEGVVLAKVNDEGTKGIVIRLSSETDFVAKNEDFIGLADKIANIALAAFPATKDDLLAQDFDGTTIGDKIIEQVGVIGEKVELAEYERLEAPQVLSYIHMGNKAGVLVGFNKASEKFEEAGRNVAMQVAAMKPLALNKDGVDSSVVEKEIEIGKEIAKKEGKPEEMLERIAMGKLNKFFKENTLLDQAYVKDNKQSVSAYLDSVESGLTVIDFKHVKLG